MEALLKKSTINLHSDRLDKGIIGSQLFINNAVLPNEIIATYGKGLDNSQSKLDEVNIQYLQDLQPDICTFSKSSIPYSLW